MKEKNCSKVYNVRYTHKGLTGSGSWICDIIATNKQQASAEAIRFLQMYNFTNIKIREVERG